MLPQVLSSYQNATTVSSAQEGLPSFQVTAVSHSIWNESSLDCPVQVFKAGTLGESEIWSLPNQGMAIAMYSWQVLPGRSVKEHSKVYIGGALKTVGTLSSACGWKKHRCKFPLKTKQNITCSEIVYAEVKTTWRTKIKWVAKLREAHWLYFLCCKTFFSHYVSPPSTLHQRPLYLSTGTAGSQSWNHKFPYCYYRKHTMQMLIKTPVYISVLLFWLSEGFSLCKVPCLCYKGQKQHAF